MSKQILQQTEEEEGRTSISIEMTTGLEMAALVARYSAAPLEDEFARTMASLATSPQMPLVTRASAANAIFNLADRLSSEAREDVAGRLKALATEELQLSDWDQEESDPFARVSFTMGKRSDVRAAALSAWSKLDPSDSQGGLVRAIQAAMFDSDPAVAASAYDALQRVQHLPTADPMVAGLVHEDSRVRAAAVGAARIRKLPNAAILERLFADPSLHVRLALLWSRRDLDDDERALLTGRLVNDPDAYVRALAAREGQSISARSP